MTPCELHGELHDTLREIKEGGEKRWAAISGLEKGKVNWKTFTWVVGGLTGGMVVVLGLIFSVIWSELKTSRGEIIHQIQCLDKDTDAKRVELGIKIDTLDKRLMQIEWKMDQHLADAKNGHGIKKPGP